MRPATPATIHHLSRDRVLRLAAPLELIGRAGTLWITIDGELEDYFLDPGEAQRIDGRAVVLVCALDGDAVLQAQALAPARPHRLVARAVDRVAGLLRSWTAPRVLEARP